MQTQKIDWLRWLRKTKLHGTITVFACRRYLAHRVYGEALAQWIGTALALVVGEGSKSLTSLRNESHGKMALYPWGKAKRKEWTSPQRRQLNE